MSILDIAILIAGGLFCAGLAILSAYITPDEFGGGGN